jgi:hypothetical protein
MKVEQLLEQMDKNIKVLTDSVNRMASYQKDEVKEIYGSIKTYNECMSMERGALTALMNFRQWIVNKNSVETHLETYEQLLERSIRKD